MSASTRGRNRAWALARAQLAKETGAVVKDWGGRSPVALIYPNSYYVGMSNLGVHALYRLFNAYREVVCERVFYDPKQPAEMPPLSLESQRPLADFAMLAFSVSYELDYFNVVRLLRAADIPILAAERDARHPIVIGGGPALSANPMPLADIFDAVCVGEAEAILPGLVPVLWSALDNREDALRELAALPGVYVARLRPEGPVTRQCPVRLDGAPVTTTIFSPDTELGDLFLIEVERGCDWGCRFCLAAEVFSPARYLPPDSILRAAAEGLKYRKRVGLVGAAVTGHPRLEEILDGLKALGADLSVSSLRIKPLPEAVLRAVAHGGGRTLALAPEAATDRLRRLVRKGIREADIFDAVSRVAAHPVRHLKLYFMLGLPWETEADASAMITLSREIRARLDRQRPTCRLSLNVAPFVPKAGTPFQWLGMAPQPLLEARLQQLARELAPRGIRVKSESPAWSEVQAVLARGGREVATTLVATGGSGLAAWQRAVSATGLDADGYAHTEWPADAGLPWAPLQTAQTTARLRGELERARALAVE